MNIDENLGTSSDFTDVSQLNASQGSRVITPSDSNSVLLATMQEMVRTVTNLSKSVDQLQHPMDEPIDESLLDEDHAEGEPAPKTQCLDASVTQLLSSASASTSGEGGQGSTQSDTPPSSILEHIAQEFQMEAPCAPPVLDKLAAIANNLAREKLPDETLTAKYKLYDRPENCTALIPVRVNPPIWDKLKSETRSNDLKFQKIQTALTKGLIAMVQVTDTLTKSLAASENEKKDLLSTEELIRKMTDAVAFTSQANHELYAKRRECIKPELHQDYRPLCSPSNPVTEWLFGDDLSKKVKDMTEVNKVGQRVSHGRQFDRGSNLRYSGPRGGRQGQKHFFDRRRFNAPRKRGNYKPSTARQ